MLMASMQPSMYRHSGQPLCNAGRGDDDMKTDVVAAPANQCLLSGLHHVAYF